MKIIGLPDAKAAEYIELLSKIESNHNPKAKAKTSSASGRFQPIKSTWEAYGYKWADVFNDKLQYEFAERFTNDNAKALQRAGCAVNFATLYGSHFLGIGTFLKIMRAMPETPVAQVTGTAAAKANPTILKGTVRDFGDWLKRKTGDDYTKRYTMSTETSAQEKPVSKPIVLPPETTRVSKPGVNLGAIIFIILVLGGAAAWAFFFGGAK